MRVLAVSRSSLNGVDDSERVSDRVIAFVAVGYAFRSPDSLLGRAMRPIGW
jgi:hypothetical protein